MLYILLALVVILALILIIASTRPNTVHYERTTVINAPPERIIPHLIDFRKWEAWSPWDKLEPDMKRNYAGASSGVGAKYAWEGKKKAGAGSMEITEANSQGVKVDLRFIKPWKAECIAQFHFLPQPNGTNVRWTMDGPNTFMGKVFGLFMNMDKLVGKDFETGLAGLKAELEKDA
jgi:hypothetical protein